MVLGPRTPHAVGRPKKKNKQIKQKQCSYSLVIVAKIHLYCLSLASLDTVPQRYLRCCDPGLKSSECPLNKTSLPTFQVVPFFFFFSVNGVNPWLCSLAPCYYGDDDGVLLRVAVGRDRWTYGYLCVQPRNNPQSDLACLTPVQETARSQRV